jgi:P4 family phage/plasmid primase-like protien
MSDNEISDIEVSVNEVKKSEIKKRKPNIRIVDNETNLPPPPRKKVSLFDFLKSHSITKDQKPKPEVTNTRISGKSGSNIYGGSYHIPNEEYNNFLDLYYQEILCKKKDEYLTEIQLETRGPVLIDVDLRFDYETTTRYYTEEHIQDLIENYLDIIQNVFDADYQTNFNIYVFEKPNVVQDESKKVTKDGIHIIIGVQCDHTQQQYIRLEMLKRIGDIWKDFPIINKWEDVLDAGISKGTTGWQLYGSKKPNNIAYELTNIYNAVFNEETERFEYSDIEVDEFISSKENFRKLSARHTNHQQLCIKTKYIDIIRSLIEKPPAPTTGNQEPIENYRLSTAGGGNGEIDRSITYQEIFDRLLKITEETQLQLLIEQFLVLFRGSSNAADIDIHDAYIYTMILPETYYTDFNKWIRVGWALRNINERLFIVWVAFSMQCKDKCKCTDIFNLYYDHWVKFNANSSSGLTKRSIIHWAKNDAPEKYGKVLKDSINYYIEKTIAVNDTDEDKFIDRGCGDFDLAQVLYSMFKGQYVCVTVKGGVWYEYIKHRWIENDSGTSLRMSISKELRDMYIKKGQEYHRRIVELANENIHSNLTEEQKTKEIKICKNKKVKINNIILRLAKTNDKKNIMTESKELFYDALFLEHLDTNPYLLCFKNGVVDFKNKVFRDGYPDDYLSKSTRINYIEDISNNTYLPVINELKDFMTKLFPVKELHDYMWDHLASTLIGTSTNQTFNMYIGVGQNGKSVLVSLMEAVLGEYKGDVPLSLVTDRRTKIGGLAPEMVALRGVRYAVMQEPSKGDRINEGVMKQITSGIDPIQARAPYMPQSITFIPQFKLVVCSNEFMEIKSQDHGTWRRIRVVDFMSMFVEKPVQCDPEKPYQYLLDKSIKEKFPLWKEVFASMLVKRVYETDGVVRDCNIVMKSSNSYRENQDYIAEYVSDCIILNPDYRVSKPELTNSFTAWFHGAYGTKPPNVKDIQAYMDKKFGAYKKNKCWVGFEISNEVTESFQERISKNRANDEEEDEGVEESKMPDEMGAL